MKDFEYKLIAVPRLDRSAPDPVRALAIKVQRVINAAREDGWHFQQVETIHSPANEAQAWMPNVLVFRRPKKMMAKKSVLVLDKPLSPVPAPPPTPLRAVRKPTIELAVQGARGDFSGHNDPQPLKPGTRGRLRSVATGSTGNT